MGVNNIFEHVLPWEGRVFFVFGPIMSESGPNFVESGPIPA